MVNQGADISYYALMNVGTPPTPYAVALDTGSSDLWFQSESCMGCDGATMKSGSSTLRQSGQPFGIRYGSGTVQGTIISDNVAMGGFTIQNQIMGLVNQTSGVLLSGNTAGLLGLAYQLLSNTGSVPFWEALVSAGQWTQPVMSFWMTRYTNVTTAREEEYGGEFRMGGTNSSLYTGDIEYTNLGSTIKAYWSIPLRQISVNGGQPMTITNLGVPSLAAIDTGTTLIGGPPDIVAQIYAQIPNSQRGTGNLARYWIYPCSQRVSVSWNFGGRTWTMDPVDFQLLTNNPQLCVGAIFEASLGGLGNPDVPQWIIGDAFLKNVYSVFRYEPPAVGFAQLSPLALGTQPQQQIPTTAAAPTGVSNSNPSQTSNPSMVLTTIVTSVPAGATGAPNSNAAAANKGSSGILALALGVVAWIL